MSPNSSQLIRALGLGFVISVVVANILGSGIYKKVAPMADTLGSPGWVLVAWVLGGLITMLGALSNAEVAGMLADTGGEYAYYKKIYNRWMAFMFGWSMFIVIQTASISSIAYVFSQSLQAIFPVSPMLEDLAQVKVLWIFTPFADFHSKVIASILIIVLTIFNTRGIKSGVQLNHVILWLIYVGIGIIVIFGLTSAKADIAGAFDFTTSPDRPVTISALFTAMLAAFWAYQGWSTAGTVGGEVKDAYRNLPRGIAIGVGIVITVYLLTNITYLSVMPVQDMQAVHAAGNQIAAVEVVRSFWGSSGAWFISALILVTTLSCTHATIYGNARIYFAMAKEKLFFRGAEKVNAHHVPSTSLWIQCTWACILVFSGTFDQLTDMVVFAIFFFYGLTTLGVFILRRRMPDAPRPYKVWGYPVVPAVFILFCIGLIINTIITQPREAGLGLLLMLTGVPVYLWYNKQRA
jgi:APA family basic amino acid/polyamine antiporter